MKLLKSVFNRQLLTIITGMMLIIMVVVWWSTKPNTRVVKSAEQIFQIANLIRKSYINKFDYWKLNTEEVINNNILPSRFHKDGSLVNSLGKPIIIGQGFEGNMIMPGRRSFDIVYTDLTMNECIALATYDYEHQEELGLLEITIKGNDETRTFSWGSETYKLPVSRPEAKKICQNNSTVLWTVE